ncbi:MAG: arginine repressor [Pseudomonadota bacterium]
MPVDTQQQEARRSAIKRLLRSRSIRTQSKLAEELEILGHSVTQSSISRDLRELQVIKDPDGYRLMHDTDDEDAETSLAYIRRVTAAGPHMLVVHTAIGAAGRVAFELDRASWPEIVGTISGDDTIFIATTGQVANRRLIARLPAQAPEDTV